MGRRRAIAVALIYSLLSTIWIIASDALVAQYFPDRTIVHSLKGLLFVLVTGGLAYWLSRRFLQENATLGEHLSLVADAAQVRLWRLNLATDQVESAGKRFNFEGENYSFAHFLTQIKADHRSRVQKTFEHSVKTGAPYRVEFPLVEGSWLSTQGRVIPGEPGYLVGVSVDITEQKQMEANLLAERRLLQGIMASSAAGIVVIDPKGWPLYINERALEILGVTREQALKMPHDDARWNVARLDGTPMPPDEMPYRQVMATNAPIHNMQFLIETPAGQRAISVSAGPLGASATENGVVFSLVDVTEEVEAREALRETNKQVMTIFASMSDAFFGLSKDWRFTYLNPMAEKLLKRPAEELLGQPIWEEYADAVGTPFYEQYHRARRENRAVHFEAYYPPLETWFQVHAYPNEDGLGVYFSDVSERREAREQLRLSEERLQLALRGADLGLWDWDVTSGKITINDQYATMLGYEPGELSLTYANIQEHIAPEDWQQIEAALDAHFRGEKPIYEMEFRMRTKEGGWRWVLSRGKALEWSEQSKPLRVVGTHFDITERREAQQAAARRADRLRLLAKIDHDILSGRNTQTIAEAALQRLLDVLGCFRLNITLMDYENGIGTSFANAGADIMRLQLPIVRLAALREKLIAGGIHIVEDMDALAEITPAEQIWYDQGVRSYATVPMVTDGKLIGVLSIGHLATGPFDDDELSVAQEVANHLAIGLRQAQLYEHISSEADRLEEMVTARTAQLKQVNQELESFAYSVSHDLRQPLRSIDGFSEAILEDYTPLLDETGKDYLRRIRASAQHLGRLIDDLLTLSRISRQEIVKGRVNLSRLAADYAAELQQSAPERSVTFDIAPEMVVEADPGLMEIALRNLLENAWKFTSHHPTAKVRVGVQCIDGQRVYFVSDDGAGFDMRFADKLFGAFQRLHTESEFPGTGVGLATVQRIVHRHGGRIWAEAAPEEGATFYFTLA